MECINHVKKLNKKMNLDSLRLLVHPLLFDVNLHIVIFPLEAEKTVKFFWTQTGEIISSRFGLYALKLWDLIDNGFDSPLLEQIHSINHIQIVKSSLDAKRVCKERIAEFYLGGADVDDVYLFPGGMSAIYNAYKIVQRKSPGLKTVQFGFCYTDSCKLQNEYGAGYHFLGDPDIEKNFIALEEILKSETISAIFTEFPANPLLTCIDMKRLYSLGNKYGALVIVDNTIGNITVDVKEYADILVTSLTKYFSGENNCMAGTICFTKKNEETYKSLRSTLVDFYVDNLWAEDAVILELNSKTFKERMQKVNTTCEKLCDHLINHKSIGQLYYPKYTRDKPNFDALPHTGYGSLFSIILKNKEDAVLFYDTLELCKGPSFGTSFTLVCTYTFMSHFDDLEFAERSGVDRFLIRVSVGLEDLGFLVESFERAFAVLAK